MQSIHLHEPAVCLQVGTLPVNQPISWRGNSLTYEASQQYGFADLTGGWITGGATGNIKMTQPIAFSTSLLAWGLLKFGTGFSKGKQSNTDSGLENVMWGADYLKNTFRTGNADQTSTDGLTIVYQVSAVTCPHLFQLLLHLSGTQDAADADCCRACRMIMSTQFYSCTA